MPPRKKAAPAAARQPQASGDRSDAVADVNQPIDESPVGNILKEIEERREAVLEAVKSHVSSTSSCQLLIFAYPNIFHFYLIILYI